MRRNTTICLALTAVVALAGCTIEPTAEGNNRRRDEVITTENTTADTEVVLAEMDFTAAEVVDLMVAQDPTAVETICDGAEDLSDEMLEQLRPRFAEMLAEGAAIWGVGANDLYDAVLDECGR